MNLYAHIHEAENFSATIRMTGKTPILCLNINGCISDLFLHGDCGDAVFEKLTEAIRVFQMERSTVGVIEGDNP